MDPEASNYSVIYSVCVCVCVGWGGWDGGYLRIFIVGRSFDGCVREAEAITEGGS